MANLSGGMNGAMQGAQLGGSIGGGWGAVIGGAIGLFVGLSSTDPQEEALKAQRKYNDLVVKNNATALFDQQRSMLVERMRTGRALQSYNKQGKVMKSQANLAFGAADIIGASAQGLMQAIDYQTTQAEQDVLFNAHVSNENYLNSLDQIANTSTSRLQRSIETGEQKPMDIGAMFSAGKQMFSGGKQVYGDIKSGNGMQGFSGMMSSVKGSMLQLGGGM